jgi:spermidine synthase
VLFNVQWAPVAVDRIGTTGYSKCMHGKERGDKIRGFPSYVPAVLALGMVCQIGQIVFLRELLMVFHGNELSLGIILAAWMLWVGLGSRLGALLIDRSKRPLLLFALTATAVPLILPASVVLIRSLRWFFSVHPGAYLSVPDMVISCFAVMAPVCLLFGIQFVLLARLWREKDGTEDTAGASKTYVGEGIGTMMGGLLFTLVLVHHLNAFETVTFAGAVLLGVGVLLMRSGTPGAEGFPRALRRVLFGMLILILASSPLLGRLDTWAYGLQWKLFAPEYRLVEIHQSKYGAISVGQREDQYSFFQSGHLVFSGAGPDATSPALEEQEALAFAHFSMVQHEDPRTILLIGGGLRGTLREMARHPVERIDYIELDRVLTDAARPYVCPSTLRTMDDPRVRMVHTDGRLHVRTTREFYDMIVVDVPDPSTAVLNRYYTEEFFQEAAARLNHNGVFVIGAVSTADMRGGAVVNRSSALYHTLKRVFPQVFPAGERFLFLFAGKGPARLSFDIKTLQSRYRDRNVETEGFSARHYEILLQEGPLRRVNWILRHHGRSRDAHLMSPDTGPLFPPSLAEQERLESLLPSVEGRTFINSDFRPIAYYYTLLFWNGLTRGHHREALTWIAKVKAWWIGPIVLVSLLTVVLLRLAGRRSGARSDTRFAVHVAVFTTGLSTMALQIALLFAFQSLYGFVYEMVGFIVALFMGGLALGAAATHRFIDDKSNLNTLTAFQLVIALFAGLIALALPGAASVESPALVLALISSITLAAGLLNGADFPLAAACSLALAGPPERATGTVYGVELFGACAGALIASIVVAPVLGIVACCLLAAVGNITAFLTLSLSRRSYGVQSHP